MGVEVGAIETGNHADDLLGRKAPASQHYIVVFHGIRKELLHLALHVVAPEDEGEIGDRRLYLTHTY